MNEENFLMVGFIFGVIWTLNVIDKMASAKIEALKAQKRHHEQKSKALEIMIPIAEEQSEILKKIEENNQNYRLYNDLGDKKKMSLIVEENNTFITRFSVLSSHYDALKQMLQ